MIQLAAFEHVWTLDVYLQSRTKTLIINSISLTQQILLHVGPGLRGQLSSWQGTEISNSLTPRLSYETERQVSSVKL